MHAIILAAGYGSRLSKPLNLKPKTLLKYKNKTIIYYLIKNLVSCKIKNITIVAGYKSELIKKHIKKNFNKNLKINFINNKMFRKRGNIYSAYLLKNKFNSEIILLNADLICKKDVLIKFVKNNYQNLFMTNKNKDINSDDILFRINKNNNVKNVYVKENIKKNPKTFPSAGIVKMSKNAFKIFINIISKKNLDKDKYYEIAYKKLIKKCKFKIYIAKKKIFEIDSKEDYNSLTNT